MREEGLASSQPNGGTILRAENMEGEGVLVWEFLKGSLPFRETTRPGAMTPKRTIWRIYTHPLMPVLRAPTLPSLSDSAQIRAASSHGLVCLQSQFTSLRIGLAMHTDDKYILNVSRSFRGKKRWF